MDEIISLEKITKRYENTKTTVFDSISLSIKEGDSIGLTGPSGSGKTTLLNMIGLLDSPTSGSISILGKNDFNNNNEADSFRNMNIGFVFQQPNLLPYLSVIENILLPVIARDKSTKIQSEDKAIKLLEKVGLKGFENRDITELSGGERQRVSLVRAFASSPKIILADEPTGSLDDKTATKVAEVLLSLNKEAKSVLITATHDVKIASLMKRQLKIENGIISEN